MSASKFLIDTNVVIGLEDFHPVDPRLSEFSRRCSKHGVRLFIVDAVDDDVSRDRDATRQAVTLSKLEKFERLEGISWPVDSDLSRLFGPINSVNDRSDCRLLHCLRLNAVDFLITHDQGIHKRAARAGLGNRVLGIQDALVWIRQTYEPTAVELPYVVEKFAYALDIKDTLFDTLREDYDGFDNWFNEKCCKGHRICWTVQVGSRLAGIIIWKDEARPDASALRSPGAKILKLCTFKMHPDFRGEKFGEQLLKKCLWHAQKNGYDAVYLTAFPKQAELIDLLCSFGFSITGHEPNGEAIVERAIRRGPLTPGPEVNVLDFNLRCYPRYLDDRRVQKFCVPIRGAYHEKLFPEISFRTQLPLFANAGLQADLTTTNRADRTPGNTIRKVYLSRASTQALRAGDLLFFYLSKDERLAASQSLTTVGVVESVTESRSLDELITLTAKRSVYSAKELEALQNENSSPVKVLDFLLVGHLAPTIPLQTLTAAEVFRGAPPQSISLLPDDRYQRLSHVMRDSLPW